MPTYQDQDNRSLPSASDITISVSGLSSEESQVLQALTHQPPKPTGKRKPATESRVMAFSNDRANKPNASRINLHNASSETESAPDTITQKRIESTKQEKPDIVIMMEHPESKKPFTQPYEALDETWSTDVREEFRSRDFAMSNAKWAGNRALIHVTVAYEVKNRKLGEGRIHFAGWTKLVRLKKWLAS